MLWQDVAMDFPYDELLPVPRSARLPIELEPPEGFQPDELATWPKVVGRLEFVDGRLLYMPPCAEEQQLLAVQLTHLLRRWAEGQSGFDVGGNEAGIQLGKEVRGADAAVWPRPSPPRRRSRNFRREAPLLAAEVAGREDAEDESALLRKAKWYLRHGVKAVWLILPETREVVDVRPRRTRRYGEGQRFEGPPELPGLSVSVDELFSVL